jgi:hypothetical protein
MKKLILLLVLGLLISGCAKLGNVLDSRAGGLWDFRSPETGGTTTASEINP